jgi:hypothetical protein
MMEFLLDALHDAGFGEGKLWELTWPAWFKNMQDNALSVILRPGGESLNTEWVGRYQK